MSVSATIADSTHSTRATDEYQWILRRRIRSTTGAVTSVVMRMSTSMNTMDAQRNVKFSVVVPTMKAIQIEDSAVYRTGNGTRRSAIVRRRGYRSHPAQATKNGMARS